MKGGVKMRILMATMQLGIGGAETHIVELSKALKKRGIEVFVASQGGAYVSELEAVGIKHFKLPLNKKTIPAMRKSISGLKEIIEEYKIDVVHSHARIPGFILANLRRRMGFRLVSTNEKYSDKFAPFTEEPRIIGKVVASFTPLEK